MQMTPAPVPGVLPAGTTCAERGEGRAPGERPRLLVATWPTTADEATAAAALISIAKAWDLEGGPKGRATLCLLPRELAGWVPYKAGPAGDEAAAGVVISLGTPAPSPSLELPFVIGGLLWIGPLASGTLTLWPSRVQAEAADPARPPEKINYTDVQGRVKAIFLRL